MDARRNPSLRLLYYLCFPFFLLFRFFRCFTYPMANSSSAGRAAGTTMAPAEGSRKKLRKPYTITKSRDRWTAEEHERFLDSLMLFGRDWKKIEDFVGTKTTIQIRSHAQKYFLKVQKIGSTVHVPPPHPKRRVAHSRPQSTTNSDIGLQASLPFPSESNSLVPACTTWDSASNVMIYPSSEVMSVPNCYTVFSQAEDMVLQASVPFHSASTCLVPACTTWDNASNVMSFTSKEVPSLPNCYTALSHAEGDGGLGKASLSGLAGKAGYYNQNIGWTGSSRRSCLIEEVPEQRTPDSMHPVGPDFAQVYSFIGTMFDPDFICSLEVYMEKLKEMDPITAKTVLILMNNLAINLSSPDFEPIRKWSSTYDVNTKTIGVITETATPVK